MALEVDGRTTIRTAHEDIDVSAKRSNKLGDPVTDCMPVVESWNDLLSTVQSAEC